MGAETTIHDIARRFADAPGLQALFLSGSHGRGTADAYSDLDYVALAPPDDHPALARAWRETLETVGRIVFWTERIGPATLLNAITEDWLRIDLLILDRAAFKGRSRTTVMALHDPDDIAALLPPRLPPATPNPARVTYQIREFLRVLGLMPVALGRGEYVTLVKGLGILRDLLSDLMLEECTEPDRGGILHLSRLLPAEDMAELAALPYPGPDREALIAAHLRIAQVFLPRARRLAAALSLDWPEAFEAATRQHIRRAVGVEI